MTLLVDAIEHDFLVETDIAPLPTPEHMGAGNCAQCSCLQYSDARNGNYYCECGHSYEDHF